MNDRRHDALRSHLSDDDIRYITEYSSGMCRFVDQHSSLALERFAEGDAAGAIVEGRKVVDIPQDIPGTIQIARIRASQDSLRHRGTVTELSEFVSQTYPIIPETVTQAIERSRLLLYGHEVVEWTMTLARLNDTHDFHGAAIGAIELADAHGVTMGNYSSKLLPPLRLSGYRIAIDSAHHRLNELSDETRNLAERKSVAAHLTAALYPVAEHYMAHDSLRGSALTDAATIIYELDDIAQPSDDFLRRGYGLLARSTRLRPKAHKYFQREVTAANERLELAKTSRQQALNRRAQRQASMQTWRPVL